MKRREFIKLSLVAGTAILIPSFTYSAELDLSKISFSSAINTNNKAQTIMIFMYGGASQLAGNLSNIDEIKTVSQSNYDKYFGTITKTANNCWNEAGGSHMERLITDGDMTLFRACYSKVREENNNKAHGLCTIENQTGSFEENSAGVVSTLAQVLEKNGIVTKNTVMPFVTLEGESSFYSEGSTPINTYLKPIGLSQDLSNNPYKRHYIRSGKYYTEAERDSNQVFYKTNEEGGMDPALDKKLHTLAQQNNHTKKIKDAFSKRHFISGFIDGISEGVTPDLGDDSYSDNQFSKKVATAINILTKNPDTKVVTLGTDGLGGWDDHSTAQNYVRRTENLFKTLVSAMAHIKAEGKEQNINIMVFGEFGRNVNLNSTQGWDHGNLQNFYVLGGKGYFKHKGVVGETVVAKEGSINRVYLKPKKGTYQFEPLSIAATLYNIYGIENPEILTNGNKAIKPLFT